MDYDQFKVLQEPENKLKFSKDDIVCITLNMDNKYAEFRNKTKPDSSLKVKIINETECAVAIFLNESSVTVVDQIIS